MSVVLVNTSIYFSVHNLHQSTQVLAQPEAKSQLLSWRTPARTKLESDASSTREKVMSPNGEHEDDGTFSPTRNLSTQFDDMGPFQTPDGNGGPPLLSTSSEQPTPMTLYAHTDMMQLIATLQQEVRELR